jgi:flagellar biosynthesis protein FlhB
MLAPRRWMQVGISLLKLITLIGLVGWIGWSQSEQLIQLMMEPVNQWGSRLQPLAISIFIAVARTLLVYGFADYIGLRWSWWKRLHMIREELQSESEAQTRRAPPPQPNRDPTHSSRATPLSRLRLPVQARKAIA